MKSVGLRRRPRHPAAQSAAGQSDTPVTVVFRVHTDSVSKAPFLYCPKNYNRPMPSEGEGFTEAIIEICVPGDTHVVSSTAGGSEDNINSRGRGAGSWTRHSGKDGSSTVSPAATAMSHLPMEATYRLPFSLESDGRKLTETVSTVSASSGAVSDSNALRLQQKPRQEQSSPKTRLNTLSTAVTSPMYDSWVCRAYCFGEKDAMHANGAISVHQSLTSKSPFINDIAKGKALARVVPTYEEVQDRFGLSHVELSFENQSVSRADMFLISEALRDRILYEGEEVALCGFKIRVNEMLCVLQPATAEGSVVRASPQGDNVKNSNSNIAILDASGEHKAVDPAWTAAKAAGPQRASHAPLPQQLQSQPQPQQDEKKERRYRRVQSGVVTRDTLVNFRSLSAVHYIIIEISKEMWDPTVDGRITLSWVMQNFLREYFTQQLQKHKASLLIQILMVGQLYPQYAIKGHVDVYHTMSITHDYRSTSLVEEVELQCEVFLRRVLYEVKEALKKRADATAMTSAEDTKPVPREAASSVAFAELADTLTEQHLFVHAKNTCTIATINLVLEDCIQRQWIANTGILISVVSAGKGLYQVTNDLLQLTCTRLFNIGIEKVNIICMGRPPLHTTPLLEYFSEDKTLRPQYHLRVDEGSRRFYERPEWARCFFYHPAADATSCGLMAFELLTRDEWMRRHRAVQGKTSHFVPGLGLQMAPLEDVLLPVMGTQQIGQVSSTFARASDLDAFFTPTFSPAVSVPLEGEWGKNHSLRFDHSYDVPATAYPLAPVAETSGEREDRMRGERFGVRRNTDELCQEDDAKTCTTLKQGGRPFLFASWYCHHGCAVSRQQVLSRECMYNVIINHTQESTGVGRTRQSRMGLEAAGIVPCGLNILDSDLQSGYVFLRLCIDTSVAPQVRWSPKILTDMDLWTVLMGAFSGAGNCLAEEEQPHFVSHLRAADIFCRTLSAIMTDERTLILASHSCKVKFLTPEEVIFTFRPALFVAADDVTPFSMTVAHVQIRNSVLFAIKPTSPYRSATEGETAAAASHNITTDVLLRRRWQFAHPELPSTAAQQSPWTALCHCKILPIYGTMSPYQRDCFFGVPTHQYSVSIRESMQLLEYVLQRLHQQYQIVVVGSSLAGVRWPREDPTRNARLDLSIGHQVHELKICETGQSISVTRMLHSGMYSNVSVTQMVSYSYLLLNYLRPGFSVRTLQLETHIGAKAAFRWESLDSYLRDRCRSEAFLPRNPEWSLREGKLCLALLPDAFDAPPVSYAEFAAFINHRFCAHFTMKGTVGGEEDRSGLTTNVPDTLDWPDPMPTRIMMLNHDNPLTPEPQCLLDHKTGLTLCLEAPTRNRMLSTEVRIPATYSPRCHCLLQFSWLVCITPIISDWIRSIVAGAARFRLRAVPLPCPCSTTKSGFFVVRYTVRARNEEEEPRFRRCLLSLLTNDTYRYFPDVTVMNRNCRLLHFSGLCYVTSQSEGTVVARWFENPMLRTGQPEHQQLLRDFTQAVQLVRRQVESP
ncbi:putative DNA-directed RNA polymerase III largest subunit [Trypanosoma rangeli]|uniref:Putative DNA-directed RNA polymerase III largest subunit n=1 Tax=Trypanosoma rangeli TaxID=5698 RepID=A0A3S5IRM0_TRYRA|nr:putative DNA-directed RNA polymerase III largest subunit [Trypanosoma rangeli]RNF07551.1 putative DNA-directed RNA polymerase III largest subunit [Trypanosoma rangeli]|eukprot:RNF07551.1 putative DNA-directed RNA polymerase III largest subunit [Trypanosoma rangeli]